MSLPPSHLAHDDSQATSSAAGGSSNTQPTRRVYARGGRVSAAQRAPPVANSPNPRAKSLLDSYRSLSPNTRITFGLAVAAVGVAGLYWDRQVAPEPEGAVDKPLIAIRAVDKTR